MYFTKRHNNSLTKHFPHENRKDNARHISLNIILCFRLFTRVHFHKQE